jgi:renalase
VLAIPSPQVSALFRQSALAEFEQVHNIKMQGCWTLMLRYDQPMSLPFEAAFVNEGPLGWVSRNSSKPGRTGLETWVLHASPAWSEAHLEEEAQAVAPLLINAFQEMGARAPSAWSAHRWG